METGPEKKNTEETPPDRDKAEELSPSSTQPTGSTEPTGTRPTQALFHRDARGRTPLFYAAEKGLYQEVWAMIFSLTGTGFYPQRLGLIEIKDHDGLTAADVAEQNGHQAIADLLRGEMGRMEYFE